MRGTGERQYVSVTKPADGQAQVRREIRAARAARDPGERAGAAVALRDRVLDIPEVVAATCVTAYIALPGEPPTDALVAALHARGCDVLTPRVVADRGLEWVRWTPDGGMSVGPWGIAEPVGPAVGLDAVDVMLVPASAADPVNGVRMGQGGGYYDRVLARLARARDGGPLRIALLFDDEVRTGLPAQSWDECVDVIVTPHRTVRPGS